MSATLWQVIKHELAPFEGRWGTTWRVASICMLAAMMFMIYQIPLVSIGCYLVLFVMKPNTAQSILMGIGICVLVCLVVPLLFVLTWITIESPIMILAVMFVCSFIFVFLGGASPLGEAGNIVALVMTFVLTLVGEVPFGEVATRGILYAWLMVLVPMGVLVAFNAAFGLSVVKAARHGIADRLQLASRGLMGEAQPKELRAALREGNGDLSQTLMFLRLFHIVPSAESLGLKQASEASYQILLASLSCLEQGQETDTAQAQALQGLAEAVLRGEVAQLASRSTMQPSENPPTESAAGNVDKSEVVEPPVVDGRAVLSRLLVSFPLVEPAVAQPPPKVKGSFLAPDAFTNPMYSRFALKTTFAAMFCYLVYTAIDWQDIHTAMITCYVAALGTTAETVHKLALRIVGCLIGASLGVASILFLIPYMSSIGELMALVFAGTLCAAWVSSGSERIAYAGVQIGLAFLMTVLQGFGPDVEMSVALDRIMGILLGNLVMYVVFTRLWPVSASQAASESLQKLITKLRPLFSSTLPAQDPSPVSGSQAPALAATPVEGASTVDHSLSGQPVVRANVLRGQAEPVMVSLNKVREQLLLIRFEPGDVRPSMYRVRELLAVNDELERIVIETSFVAGTAATQRADQALARMEHDVSVAQP